MIAVSSMIGRRPDDRVTCPYHFKNANWSGTGTSHDHLDWPRLSNREQFKKGEEEADRGN